jgi:hypothetical protein
MSSSQPTTNETTNQVNEIAKESIASFTVADLEVFVTNIAKKVIQQEQGNPLLGGLTAEEILAKAYDTTVRPFWEVALEMFKDLTEEDWAGIPTDASANVDYYLYGAPKDEE